MTTSNSRTEAQQAYMTSTLARMKREILADLQPGGPCELLNRKGLTCFSELHDCVDANGYGGFFEDSGAEDKADRVLRGLDLVAFLFPDSQESIDSSAVNLQSVTDVCNELQNQCDEWIKAGMPTN